MAEGEGLFATSYWVAASEGPLSRFATAPPARRSKLIEGLLMAGDGILASDVPPHAVSLPICGRGGITCDTGVD